METVLMIALIGVGLYCCFLHGVMVGRNADKHKKVERPKIDFMKSTQDARSKREAQREKEYLDALLRNIDNYDGTGFGQEELPRR